MVYLALTEHPGDFLIVYRKDKDGNLILNPDDILLIKFFEIQENKTCIGLNGDNYKIVRYEALEKGRLKDVVDEKIRNLEAKIKKVKNESGISRHIL